MNFEIANDHSAVEYLFVMVKMTQMKRNYVKAQMKKHLTAQIMHGHSQWLLMANLIILLNGMAKCSTIYKEAY